MLYDFKKQLLKKIGLGLGLIILAIVLVQLIAWRFQTTAQTIDRQKQELALRIQATDAWAALKLDSENAKPYFSAVENSLPSKDKLTNFGPELINMAKKNNVGLEFNVSGESPNANDIPGAINFSINATGTYANFVKFLTTVENSKYFVAFDSVDATRNSGETFKILANGKVYHQTASAPPPTTSQINTFNIEKAKQLLDPHTITSF